MKKENKKTFSEKLSWFSDLVKNTKFLLLTTLALVIIGVALISGDGKSIIQNLYENITGKKHQTYTPVQDYSSETYIILKDKLSREPNIELEKAEITIFEESNTLHKYRVEYKDEIYFYHVTKTQNGTWQIKQE